MKVKEISAALRLVLKAKSIILRPFKLHVQGWMPGILTWEQYEKRVREDFEIKLARYREDEHKYIDAKYGDLDRWI